MNDPVFFVVKKTLAAMTDRPEKLAKGLAFHSEEDGPAVTVELVAARLGDSNDPVKRRLHEVLVSWDHVESPSWGEKTLPNTKARRDLIYRLLQATPEFQATLHERIPFYQGLSSALVEDDEPRDKWCTEEILGQHDFYWKSFLAYLRDVRGLSPEAIGGLDSDVTRVVTRLGCPFAATPKQARGLVVGYVQSGKTTHFTGVIARAIDLGYRLVIVLSGTIDLLRAQTQRRLDMELVGKENIRGGAADNEVEHDYQHDRDWAKFVEYGGRPSSQGQIDIVRLTGASSDFQSLKNGIQALEINRHEKTRRLFDRINLANADARLVVVKKNGDRLRKLIEDLKQVKSTCLEVPALIIDDESDQASVNTRNPASGNVERTPINKRIVDLLKLLPRAQYIGYTATPFANVLINPDDEEDIYPRDFILSLRRPEGYMGVREFHDLDGVMPGRISNEKAHVRAIVIDEEGDSGDAANILSEEEVARKRAEKERVPLQNAIDAFVLAGAIKMFRRGNDESSFRHHTMLIHESRLKTDHWSREEIVRDLWSDHRSVKGLQRLRRLFEEDFRPVSDDRRRNENLGADSLKLPGSFEDLKPFIVEALDRISSGPGAVRVVNGDEDAQALDFDNERFVWCIVIGGAKLSRGFTIEGLTVSYFRRSAATQDTLLQMGRWFGYRKGYQDLVRLYIGRKERVGRRTIDLYDAFERICRDEEDFRQQLWLYSEAPEGGTHVTPRQVPALVYSSDRHHKPAARNKMFNAVLEWSDFSARRVVEPVQRKLDVVARDKNAGLFRDLLKAVPLRSGVARAVVGGGVLLLKAAEAPTPLILRALEGLDWPRSPGPISPQLNYLRRPEAAHVRKWFILFPQIQEAGRQTWAVGKENLSIFERTLATLESGIDQFKVFSESRHVDFARWLIEEDSKLSYENTCGLQPNKNHGVMLVYPTAITGEDLSNGPEPVIGFALLLAGNASGPRCAFTVRVKDMPRAVTVAVSGKGSA